MFQYHLKIAELFLPEFQCRAYWRETGIDQEVECIETIWNGHCNINKIVAVEMLSDIFE